MFDNLKAAFGIRQASPPLHPDFSPASGPYDEADADARAADPDAELHPIAGFTCVIEYADAHGECSERLITCRSYELRNGRPSICAICHMRNGFRRFIIERIEAVYNPVTHALLGTGAFFEQFTPDVSTEGVSTWGLTRSRKATLIAGLNILAFMARCDGQWHPLEEPVFTDFIDDLWITKGWPGEPPMCAIMDHAHSLSPDTETFFAAIRCYARSSSSTRLLLGATSKLIAADGVIAQEEFDWALSLKDALIENASI